MTPKAKPETGMLEAFLKPYDNENTRGGYSAAVYTFMDFVYGAQRKGGKVSSDEKRTYEGLLTRYFSENRNLKDDFMGFAASLQTRPPLSARKTFSFVKEFLSAHDVELKHQDLKRIRFKLPKGGSRTVEKDLDIDTIRSILQHLDVKGRALVLVLASSGMRIAEALSITLNDVNLKEKPATILIRGENTKTGENRFTFISSEASAAVTEWLKVRDAYLKSAQHRNNGFVTMGTGKPKASDDNRLFPFSDQTASVLWDGALKKAGFFSRDESTKRKQLHYHMFRKFFISQLSLAVSKEIPEMLAGHEGYLTSAYRNYTKKQLAEQYLKAERMVTIQGDADVAEIREQLDSTTKDLQATKQGSERTASALSSIVLENVELKTQLETMRAEIGNINRRMQERDAAMESLDRFKLTQEDRVAIAKLMADEIRKEK